MSALIAGIVVVGLLVVFSIGLLASELLGLIDYDD
jgi:hypothetical protein